MASEGATEAPVPACRRQQAGAFVSKAGKAIPAFLVLPAFSASYSRRKKERSRTGNTRRIWYSVFAPGEKEIDRHRF